MIENNSLDWSLWLLHCLPLPSIVETNHQRIDRMMRFGCLAVGTVLAEIITQKLNKKMHWCALIRVQWF